MGDVEERFPGADAESTVDARDTQPLGNQCPRVAIVSDIRLCRQALSESLSRRGAIEVAGVADSAQPEQRLAHLQPDVLLLDASLPGRALVPRLAQALPDARVVVFAVGGEEQLLTWAELGITGCVDCEATIEDMIQVVHRAARGEAVCSPRLAAALLGHCAQLAAHRTNGHDLLTMLSIRERDVLELIEQGLSNKEIARQLKIGLPTVKNHVHRVLAKLEARSRSQAAAWFRREREAVTASRRPRA